MEKDSLSSLQRHPNPTVGIIRSPQLFSNRKLNQLSQKSLMEKNSSYIDIHPSTYARMRNQARAGIPTSNTRETDKILQFAQLLRKQPHQMTTDDVLVYLEIRKVQPHLLNEKPIDARTQQRYLSAMTKLTTVAQSLLPLIDPMILKLKAQSLKSEVASLKPHQAQPITLDHVRIAISKAPTRELKDAIWLAWRTASRVGDFRFLNPRADLSIINSSTQLPELQITFANKTKGSRKNPWRVELYPVIPLHPLELPLAKRLTMSTAEVLFPTISTQTVRKHLQKTFPLHHYTAHSIKRGAATLLSRAAAEGTIQPHTLSIALKHVSNTGVSRETVRYTDANQRHNLFRALKVSTLFDTLCPFDQNLPHEL